MDLDRIQAFNNGNRKYVNPQRRGLMDKNSKLNHPRFSQD
jgi:hypothetical protein